jgi:hypothetical protein
VVIGGRTLKVHLSEVTATAWEHLRSKLETHGQLYLLEGESLKEQLEKDKEVREVKTARAAALADVAAMTKVSVTLAELHGCGGAPAKRRRLARRLGDAVSRASRACAYGLREVAAAGSDDDAGDAEAS